MFLNDLLNAVSIGILKVNKNGEIYYINKVIQDNFKLNINNDKGLKIQSVIPISKITSLIQQRKSEVITNQTKNNEFIIEFLNNNKISGTVIYIRELDYSDLLNLYNIVDDVFQDLNELMNLSDELVTITDSEGEILRVSAQCERIMGVKKSAFIGKSVYSLQDSGILSYSSTIQVLNTKKKCEVTQITHAGRRLFVRGYPVFDNKGELKKVVNLSKDITKEYSLEKSLAEKEKLAMHYNNELKKLKVDNQELVYNSKSMKRVYEIVNRIADTTVNVLLLGESGVGKGVIANAIYKQSDRNDKPFVKVNCGAIPENLIEAELFGYTKGAFTGAEKEGKEGLFKTANKGTIFLDEIGELPLNLQVKLLQVLQEREVTPIGSTIPVKVDVRIISATNRDLDQMVESGLFRSDLYYRINTIPITIPPLRERTDDIPFLIKHFIDKYNEKYQFNRIVDNEVISILMESEWKGNVRELENMIERLVITAPGNKIDNQLLFSVVKFDKKESVNEPRDGSLKELLYSYEKEILLRAWKNSRTIKEVSDKLKVDISTISRKFKKHNIKIE